MDGIWIDRDGNCYGPYTPDEFLAYLASGHIVASDRARVGERGGFEPVPKVAARIAGQPPSVAAPLIPRSEPVQPVRADTPLPPPAGFWRRVGAYVVDAVLAVTVILTLSITASVLFAGSPAGTMKAGIVRLVASLDGTVVLFGWLVLWPLYFALLESSPWQATLGKRVFGLIVTDRDGARISFGRALGRHVAAVANYLSLMVGWLLVAIPGDKRGLHDQIAGTRVLCDRQPPVSPWIGFVTWVLAGVLFALLNTH